jgi:citrate lyase gamma subunit
LNVDKLETSKSIVYTYSKLENEDENYYHVNVNIPIININNDIVKDINSRITNKFSNKVNTIMRAKSEYTTYKVDYVAYVNNGAVSVAIREISKTGNKAETETITTYNYSIPDKKEITLKELITLKESTVDAVQESIDSNIKVSAENAEEIAKEYGSAFTRNIEDEMYKIDNIDTFFLTDEGYVYIIFDYGKSADTNEMDIVIF